VSLTVEQGEVMGIVGRNGAGKTTLLKVLSRITEPTSGRVRYRGRVASLLEVGTGFHPELTGRENVYLNAAILGMKRGEVQRKFDAIVSFAEIERFLDTPVKRYSSGMYVRLAFAVAAHLEPEILVVDEVLAVGDVAFQQKCIGRMHEVAGSGRTVLFVSHNMGAINDLCDRAAWLHEGRLQTVGEASRVVGDYLAAGTTAVAEWRREDDAEPDEGFAFDAARVLVDGAPSAVVAFDSAFFVELDYRVLEELRNAVVLARVVDAQGRALFTTSDSDTTDLRGAVRAPGSYTSACRIPGSFLRPGRYWLTIEAYVPGDRDLALHEQAVCFDVSHQGYSLNIGRVGVITPVFDWTVRPR
jgi:lipopolysaccharide transport system ATP-binding protein